jgi:hypothetical protein
MKKVALALLLLSSSAAFADCRYNGKQYPVGTIINGYICTAGGKWKPANLWYNTAIELQFSTPLAMTWHFDHP